LPAQYQAAFDQPLRTESKLRKYLEGLDGFELCEGDKPGTHCLRRKSSPPPQKKARREVRTTAENVISVEASPAPQSEFNPVRRAASPLQKLHDEILAFRDVVAPSSTERAAREDAFRTLERAAKSCWPRCEAKVFGSALTKLELPSSDVDVVVFGAPVDKGSGGVAKRLRTLASALEDLGAIAPRCVILRPFVRHRRGVRGGRVPVGGEYAGTPSTRRRRHRERARRSLEVVESARIPLVKYVDAASGTAVDVSFDVESGLRTGKLVRSYMDAMPPLRPLVLVLKFFLAQRGLNETFTGGVGSYMLQLMVVSFLQQRHRTDRATGLVSPQNLGSLLLEFFELYGRDLNPTITGISVRRHGAYFPKRSRNWFNPARPNLLAIENPDDDKLDVGKNSYNYHRVRRAFDHAHDAIVAASTREDWRRTCLLGIVVDMSVWNERVLQRGLG
jgi:non-canonical poly(A) RNA polymerase PAPD5/7